MPGLAGMSHLSYRKFLAANAAGAVCWGVTYTLLGYYAGHALDKIEKYSGFVGLGVLVVVIAVIVGLYLLHRRREKRALAVSPLEPDDDLPKRGE
jgi:membrane protein DedA with SNARE-associated domain